MYKVVVLAHNLKEIETEPVEVVSKSGPYFVSTVMTAIGEIIPFVEHDGLKNRSLTIEISEAEK